MSSTAVASSVGGAHLGEMLTAVDELVRRVSDPGPLDDAEMIDALAGLERLKRVAAAGQAVLSAAFDASRRRQQLEQGVPAAKVGRGVSDQIALARMESPHRGNRHLGLAKALVHEMPCTLAALERGDVSEWGATLVARETAVLSVEHRRDVDARLATTMATQGVSERQLADAARAMAYELDPAGAVERAAKAEADRCVTVRPAPDCMAYVTAHVPVRQGVAVYATLDQIAKQAAAQGDPRSRGQVMADALVTLVTDPGAEPTANTTTPVTVHLVMPDDSLLGDGDAPAVVPGHGPVPAAVARRMVADAAEADVAWLRRLYATPDGSQLVAMESRSRAFPAGLAQMIRLRDQVCATPWCDAPIRHVDHVLPWSAGGRTTAGNGQGLCEHCNLVKEDAGFTTVRDGPRTTVSTPTGHRYDRTAPPLGGLPPPRTSPLETSMRRALRAA